MPTIMNMGIEINHPLQTFASRVFRFFKLKGVKAVDLKMALLKNISAILIVIFYL